MNFKSFKSGMVGWWWVALMLFLTVPSTLYSQPAVKSFLTITDMVTANPYQVADPTPTGGRTATVIVQNPSGIYALTNTWAGTNTSTLLASTTPTWAWQLLAVSSGPTFYTADGEINTARIVTLGGKPLTFQGPGSITNNPSEFVVNSSDDILLKSFSDIDLNPGQRLLIRPPGVAGTTPTARTGDILTLLNASTGESDFRTLTAGTNIYNNDGIISTNRTVNLGNRTLTFKGPGIADFNAVDSFQVTANQFAKISSPGNVILESPGLLSLRTPNVVGGGAQEGQVLTLSKANGQVEFASLLPGGGSNIYNSDGTLTGHRLVNLTNFNLTIQGAGNFAVNDVKQADLRATNTILGGRTGLFLKTPNIYNASASTGQVVTLVDALTGKVEYQNPAVLPTANIYNTSGTLTSDRVVEGASKDLSFTNIDLWGAYGEQSTLRGRLALNLQTPKVAGLTAAAGQILALQNATNGQVDFQTLTNIYSNDGTITADRTAKTGTNLLTFDATGGRWQVYNAESVSTGGKTNTVYGQNRLMLSSGNPFIVATPSILNQTAKLGDVLSLSAITAGTEAAADFRTPTNLYTFDGTLASDRRVEMNGKDLVFNAPGSLFSVFSAETIGLSGLTNQVWGFTNMIIGSDGQFKLRTPGQVHAQVNPGMVLTMTTTDGDAEYKLPPNIYNTNGTLIGHRTLDGQFNDLALTNIGYLSMRGRTSVLSGSLELDVRTPNVAGASAVSNQVLTLMDVPTGRVEFKTLPAAPTTVYTGDGTVATARSITVPAGMYLRTIGSGDTILNSANTTISSGNTTIVGSTALVLATSVSAPFNFRTPRFYSGTAKDGDVLTMINRAAGFGEVDYFPPNNLYTSNGTLTAARTLLGGGFSLSMSNLVTLHEQATNVRLYAGSAGEMILGTPKVMQGGQVANGWILSLTDAVAGRVEFIAPPTPGSGDGSIYLNDGAITSATRTLSFGGKRLIFSGPGAMGAAAAFDIDTSSNGRFSLNACTNDQFASGLMRIGGGTNLIINTPGTIANPAARTGMFLQWDGTKSEYASVNAGADTSLYNTNGTLLGNRVLTGGNFDLTFTGVRGIDMKGQTGVFGGTNSLKVITPTTYNSAGQIGQFLRLTAADGTADFQTYAPNTIYTANDTLTSARTVGGGASRFGLTFNNMTGFSAIADTTTIQGTTALKLLPPGGAAANQVLTSTGTDGTATWQTPSALATIYTASQSITPAATTRDVGLNSSALNFNGPGFVAFANPSTFDVTAVTRATLKSTAEATMQGNPLKIRTPRVQSSAAVAQQEYLRLDASDGTVEFATVPGAVNIYNKDGTLTGTNPRILTGAGMDLTFQGVGTLKLEGSHAVLNGTTDTSIGGQSSISISSGNTLTMSGQTVSLIGSTSATFGSSTKTLITTPGAAPVNASVLSYDTTVGSAKWVGGTAASGNVLTYDGAKPIWQTPTDVSGIIEYYGETSAANANADPIPFIVSPKPSYTKTGAPDDFIRCTFRAKYSTAWEYNHTRNITVKLGSSDAKPVIIAKYGPLATDVSLPAVQDIPDKALIELVYDSSAGAWIMLNFAINGYVPGLAQGGLPTVKAPPSVVAVTYAGVVDTFSDLAGVPLTFKKVSTLGFLSVGDGKHADYYQTAYGPIFPGQDAVRSTIDANIMWKKLVAQ